MFADIIVDISVESLDRTFQYKIPDALCESVKIGSRVWIPFGKGNRKISGYVVGISENAQWPPEKMKSILSIDEKDIPVEGQLLQLAAWIRNRYGATMNEALKTVLPIKKQIKSVEEHWLNFVVSEQVVKEELEVCKKKHYVAKVRLLEGMIREGGQMTTKLAAAKYGVTKSVVDGLVKQGILSVTGKRVYRNPIETEKEERGKKVVLNEEQQAIIDNFSFDYQSGIRKTYLIYGVTGSGKTEVYMHMISQVLKENRQVIVLIPEIALTYQTVQRFRSRFGDRVSILNSRMSDGERFDQYERAKKGDVDIIVGPRSALFVPFSRLGLIIIDEEHESSYKSENPPKYHAKEVAIRRAEMASASVVLGSATPSIESFYEAKEGNIQLYTMEKRAGNATFPTVHVVDLRKELEEGNRSVFSKILQQKLAERLQKGEQSMLFLNRRGYAGFVSCRSCGYVVKCTHCDVSMKAHKNHVGEIDTLMCHYCGHSIYMPKVCPECGSPYIATFGLGTQKVEEMLARQFPKARVLRMDGDTTTGKGGHEQVLRAFRGKKADILIGTQMIVKGHDFPDVTLVAALAADMSMHDGDYRSSERTFELLMQAAGRAGRGDKPGEMIIQTYDPEQYCIEAVKSQDAMIFYDNELAYRRLSSYPPYYSLMAALVMAEDAGMGKACIENMASELKKEENLGILVVGPTEAGLSRAKDRYRFVMYVKCRDEEMVIRAKNIMEQISHQKKWDKKCTIQYDLNPMTGY